MNYKEVINLVKQTKPLFEADDKLSQVTVKGKSDYVTEIDFSVQAFLKKSLHEKYPSIQFLGEEGTAEKIDFSGKVWILDPVDGTTNLMHRFRMSTVSLALVDNGNPVFGVIYQPFTEELYYGERGKGAFLNDQPIHVSGVSQRSDSLIFMGPAPYYKEQYGNMVMEVTKNIFFQCQDIRSLGSAALELAYIACGRADGYFEKVLKPWDFAAGALILTEAGGRICKWDKSPLAFGETCSVLADNGNMGDWLLEALAP